MMKFPSSKAGKPDVEAAQALALQGLSFLAGDAQRLTRFLSLTGFDPGDLRSLAATSEFQAAVLEHLMNDESLLIVFASEVQVKPETVGPALEVLNALQGEPS